MKMPNVLAFWHSRGRHALRAGPLRRAGALLDYAVGGVGAFLEKSSGLAGYRAKGLFGPRLQDTVQPVGFNRAEPRQSMLESLIEIERSGRFVAEYLKKVDGATMHYGLEARSPFLDQELWDWACALPEDLRLRHGELKAILRALARRHIGLAIGSRKKRGFRIPAQRWLARHWLARGEQAFQNSMLARDGWIDAENALAELRRAAQAGEASEALWNLFVIESWLQRECNSPRAGHGSWRQETSGHVLQGSVC
jgi:asparagine synthase (glutamine-hydrolysing)